MNIVRLGMIVCLAGIAIYALSIYAAMPTPEVLMSPQKVEVQALCPSFASSSYGIGVVLVALVALAGAISVSAVDLYRRVY